MNRADYDYLLARIEKLEDQISILQNRPNYHIINTDENLTWTIQHPLSCTDLFNCRYTKYMQDKKPRVGKYKMESDGIFMTWTPI